MDYDKKKNKVVKLFPDEITRESIPRKYGTDKIELHKSLRKNRLIKPANDNEKSKSNLRILMKVLLITGGTLVCILKFSRIIDDISKNREELK